MSKKIHESVQMGQNNIIGKNVILEKGVIIGNNCIINDNVTIKENTKIGNGCILGEYINDYFISDSHLYVNPKTVIGKNSLIRSMTIIYADNNLGDFLETGHRVTIREKSDIGHHVRIGTLSDIQGFCKIGNYVRMHSNVHVGQESNIKDFVWLFPYCILTNDPTPPSNRLFGTTLEKYSVLATGTIVLPNMRIGEASFIGAHSLVNKNVEAGKLYAGNPAKYICEVKDFKNRFTGEFPYPWMKNFERGMPWEGIGYDKWLESSLGRKDDEL